VADATFRLSRIFAEGWNAARALPASESDGLEQRHVVALNPYATEPERSRWSEGFAKALWK
jgi:hypothetical protein